MRINHYQQSPEDGVSQFLLEGSSLPEGVPGRAGLNHGSDAPSIDITNRSEAGGSVRNSSTRSDCSRRTGNGTAPPPTCSPSSSLSDFSVLDGIGDNAYAKTLQRAKEDGTVRASLSHQKPSLECLWGRMTGCRKVFNISNSAEWDKHMKEHFVLKEGRRGLISKYIGPPTSNSCGFCPRKFQAESGDSSWSKMAHHVVEKHYMHGHHLTRIDWPLVEYLWENRLLTPAEYRELKPIKNTRNLPSPPGLSDDEDPIVKIEEGRHRRG